MITTKYLYDAEYYRSVQKIIRPCMSDKVLSYTVVKNGRILPCKIYNGMRLGGVLTEEGNWCETTGIHDYYGGAYNSGGDIDIAHETVIYLGLFHSTWGHCITDHIRRLWFFKSNEYKEFANLKCVYTSEVDIYNLKNFARLLEILELDIDNWIRIGEIHCYDEIIIPDECFFNDENGNRFYTIEYKMLIDDIRRYAKRNNNFTHQRKIYLSYGNFMEKRMYGENVLERYFEEKGYNAVSLHRYSFDDQINILWNSECIASTEGSISHNILFCQDGTNVILIPRAYYISNYQIAINDLCSLNIEWVDASLSIFCNWEAPWSGPFFFYISSNLMMCFGENINERDIFCGEQVESYLQYANHGMMVNSGKAFDVPEFYLSHMLGFFNQYLNYKGKNRVDG